MTDITELAHGNSLRKKLNRRLNDAYGFQRTSGGKHTTISLSIAECKSVIAALGEHLTLVEALETEKRICATWRKTAESTSEKLEKAQAAERRWHRVASRVHEQACESDVKIDELEAIRAAAEKLVRCKGRYHSEQNYRALAALFGVTTPDLPPLDGEPVGEVIEVGDALLVEWHKNLEEGAKLYTEQQAPVMPFGLHPDTQKLVTDFCTALAEKLYKAQLKYGYDADWKQDGWPSQCHAHFHQHIAKGDPRDVAAYCAFMWWHGWSTKPAEGLESRTVTVKLPDYRNTYKSPFADEVEHQVRLALELFSSAAGIKVKAE